MRGAWPGHDKNRLAATIWQSSGRKLPGLSVALGASQVADSSVSEPSRPLIALGGGVAAIGIYFALVGTAALPPPSAI